VKRWRDGAMVVRWTAAGMEVAASKFRRIKGYRELPNSHRETCWNCRAFLSEEW
jgi:hypothetical protein